MKVTAIIPDDLIEAARKYAGKATTTESLIKVLREWISIQELSKLKGELAKRPLRFKEEDIASRIRRTNRQIS